MPRAGFIALAGLPNAGKSTLLNALLGRKLAIVSALPQTTRHRILGILEDGDRQACLLDTPGLLDKTADLLQKSLRVEAARALREDADLIVYLVDAAEGRPAEAASAPDPRGVPVILALNKCDREGAAARLPALEAAYAERLSPAKTLRLSALKGAGVAELKAELLARLPEGEPFYESGSLSDRWERFFAAELVREQVFALYRDEVPHATAVTIETYREAPGRPDEIHAVLHVERDSQKGIILGKKGLALRRVRERAEAALETFLGRRVVLELWVKVRRDWRKDPRALKEFGYTA